MGIDARDVSCVSRTLGRIAVLPSTLPAMPPPASPPPFDVEPMPPWRMLLDPRGRIGRAAFWRWGVGLPLGVGLLLHALLGIARVPLTHAEVAIDLPLPEGTLNLLGRVLYTNVPGNRQRAQLPVGMGVLFVRTPPSDHAAISDTACWRSSKVGRRPKRAAMSTSRSRSAMGAPASFMKMVTG